MTAVTLMVTSKLLFIGGPLGKSSLSGTMASTPLNVRMKGAAVNMNMGVLKSSQKDKLSKTGTKAMILRRGQEEIGANTW